MNILELGDIGEYLYCPLTGKPIFGEIDPQDVQSVVAFWALEVPEEPTFIKDNNLQRSWDLYLENLETTNSNRGNNDKEYPDPEEFLTFINTPGLFCFKVYQCYGCLIVFDINKAIQSIESKEN
jgi:hypothetical protein